MSCTRNHGFFFYSLWFYFLLGFFLFLGSETVYYQGAEPNRSQEFWDSTVMCLWGIVNTFTEHKWGESWSHGDYQHTSMGIIWWCGGLLGMWISRKNGTRNVIPALLLIYTGYAMSEHSSRAGPMTTARRVP